MTKFLGIIFAILIFIITLPFMILWTLISSFWVVFGLFIISFFIIALFGGTIDECLKYSGSLSFFVGVVRAFISNK
jgi:hypothetical protein